MNLQDKTIFLTGAASGLGRELAIRLDAKGCRLLLVDCDADGLATLQRDLRTPGSASFPCDLGDAAQRAALIAEVSRQIGQIDLLIHSAGIGSHSSLSQLSVDEVEQVMQVNTLAPLALTAGLLPLLPKTQPGCIVNIGSIAGELHPPAMSLYSASKAALHAFSQAITAELAGTNISCLLVILAAMSGTRFVQSIRHPASGQPGWYRKLDVPPAQAAVRIIRAVEKNRTQLVIPGWYGAIITLSVLFAPLTRAITQAAYRRLRAAARR